MVPAAPRYEGGRDFVVAIRLVRICHAGSLTLETFSVLAAALSVWSVTRKLSSRSRPQYAVVVAAARMHYSEIGKASKKSQGNSVFNAETALDSKSI
jgi:hypothetical protein